MILGWRSLAQADIDSGRLTIPFDLALEMAVAFYLVYPEASAEQPKLARFREWLLGGGCSGRRAPRASEVPADAGRAGGTSLDPSPATAVGGGAMRVLPRDGAQ